MNRNGNEIVIFQLSIRLYLLLQFNDKIFDSFLHRTLYCQ